MQVVNVKREACDVYIGRRRQGMHFGNPFPVGTYSRDEAIELFEQWLYGRAMVHVEPQRRQWIIDNIDKLNGRLGCFCKPESCHGDVLKRIAEYGW